MISKLKNTVKDCLNRLYILHLRHAGVRVGNHVFVNGHILLSGTKNIDIADDVYINSNEKSNPIGGNIRCYFKTLRDGLITIGKGVRMSNVAICSFSHVAIGENVYIGGDVRIYDTDFHSINYAERIGGGKKEPVLSKPVTIEKGVFIGTHTIILKGVTIGEYSIIGAGSVVTKDIPDNEIWAGNPARFIKRL